MKIVSLTTTPLDECHAMIKVHWEAFYQKQDGSEALIDSEVMYLVQTIGDTPKIFGYQGEARGDI
jgi:hypothetical protein